MAVELEFEVLDDSGIQQALKDLSGWEQDDKAIRKTFVHNSFLESVAFVNRVAVVAEGLNHHPDFDINFKRVVVRIWAHKMNATTKADITLAHEIEKVS